MPGDYEIGYGKPPKYTQFQKGGSGNPKGRPKKPLDFDKQLLREAGVSVNITENGRRIRVAKHDVAIRQLVHKAMAGDMNALKIFIGLYQQAREKAVLAAQQASDSWKQKNARDLTDEQLMEIILSAQKETEEKGRK